MLTPNVLALLNGRRSFRRYRAALAQAIQLDPALQLLPRLLDLPLAVEPLPDPAAILAAPASITLSGPPASGRTLALLQTLARWAEHGAAGPVVYLSLADSDAANLSPRAIITGAFHRAGLPPALSAESRPCILLIDDLEQLPANRRALWQQLLCGLETSWPAARAVVALPAGEQLPGFQAVELTVPGLDRLGAWLGHLLPNQEIQPILTALTSGHLARLRHQNADLAALALTYPLSGMPASRTQLYEQVYALFRPLLDDDDRLRARPAEPGGPRSRRTPVAVQLAPGMLVGRAALRHYRLARSLAGGADLAILTDLPGAERAAVAPLAAGLLDDPSPVLRLLWGDGSPDPLSVAGMVACLCERPAQSVGYALPLIDLLAQQATPSSQRLLAHLAPSLPELLATAAPERATIALRLVAQARSTLGAERLATLLVALIDHPGADPTLRWAAADLLIETAAAGGAAGDPSIAPMAPPGADTLALAIRCVLGAPAGSARVGAPELRPGLLALLDGAYGAIRRRTVASALLTDAAAPEDLRALALATVPDPLPISRALLGAAIVDPTPEVRRAALTAIGRDEPAAALSVLAQALSGDLRPAVQVDLLAAIAALPQVEAGALLARCALNPQLGATARMAAIDLLAKRGREGAAILLRLLTLPRLGAPGRAAVARHLGRMGVGAALPDLRAILLGDGAPQLRRAAAVALGDLVRRPALREAALAALSAGLAHAGIDSGLIAQIALALGMSGASAAIPALGRLLSPLLDDELRAAWLAHIPDLAILPAAEWPGLSVSPTVRVLLLEQLAVGATPADQPTSLAELVGRQTDAILHAAVTALTAIGSLQPSRRNDIRALLRRALRSERRQHAIDRLLIPLAAISANGGAGDLEAFLSDPGADLRLRWCALDRLGRGPVATPILLRRLETGSDDGFICGRLIELLGEQRARVALPALRQLAEQRGGDPHLRRCAIAALGRLAEPAAEATLLRIILDGHTALDARSAAAAALPPLLDPSACQSLRDLLRIERQPHELAAAVLAALGRSSDREALSLLLRYAQSEQPLEAMAAITAIVAVGERSVAPTLVRVTQSNTAPLGVRLAAVLALLQLWGAEYLPLLRDYLHSPLPPLRLQAHAALARLAPDDERLVAPVADTSAPLALRLAAIGHLAATRAADPVLPMLVINPDEPPQIRIAAAQALAKATDPIAVDGLAAALTTDGPPQLHRHCVEGLTCMAESGGPTAEPARLRLAQLAWQPHQPEIGHWAATALIG